MKMLLLVVVGLMAPLMLICTQPACAQACPSSHASTESAAGLLHYQQNRDCSRTAKYTISYNSDDPQTVNQAIVS
jgi:hypothetical protein